MTDISVKSLIDYLGTIPLTNWSKAGQDRDSRSEVYSVPLDADGLVAEVFRSPSVIRPPFNYGVVVSHHDNSGVVKVFSDCDDENSRDIQGLYSKLDRDWLDWKTVHDLRRISAGQEKLRELLEAERR